MTGTHYRTVTTKDAFYELLATTQQLGVNTPRRHVPHTVDHVETGHPKAVPNHRVCVRFYPVEREILSLIKSVFRAETSVGPRPPPVLYRHSVIPPFTLT